MGSRLSSKLCWTSGQRKSWARRTCGGKWRPPMTRTLPRGTRQHGPPLGSQVPRVSMDLIRSSSCDSLSRFSIDWAAACFLTRSEAAEASSSSFLWPFPADLRPGEASAWPLQSFQSRLTWAWRLWRNMNIEVRDWTAHWTFHLKLGCHWASNDRCNLSWQLRVFVGPGADGQTRTRAAQSWPGHHWFLGQVGADVPQIFWLNFTPIDNLPLAE